MRFTKRIAQSKDLAKHISLERMYRLFELAEQEFAEKPERSRRYVKIARKIGTRNKVTLPEEFKLQFCKNCGAFLKQGKNAELRIEKGMRKLTCMECSHTRKIKTGAKA